MKTVNFGIGWTAGIGIQPSIDTNGQQVILSYGKVASQETIYRIGKIYRTTIIWNEEQVFKGTATSVAINTKNEVIAACTEGEDILVKRFSLVNNKLSLTKTELVGKGECPKIDLNTQGEVFLVYVSLKGDLAFSYGTIKPNYIVWSNVGQVPNIEGFAPDIAINDTGQFIYAYHKQNEEFGNKRVHTVTGQIQRKIGTVLWIREASSSNSTFPSIAMANDSTFALLSQTNERDLGYQVGGIITQNNTDDQRLDSCWIPPCFEEESINNSVGMAVDGSVAVKAYESNRNIKVSVTSTIDRRSFMHAMLPQIKDLPLNKMAFPAANNSGSYLTGSGRSAGVTQDFQFGNQWWSGSRYFDFRLNDQLHFETASGVSKHSVKIAFEELSKYCKIYPELIIVKITLPKCATHKTYKQLIADIKKPLKSWLVTPDQLPKDPNGTRLRLAEVTMGHYLVNGAAVIVVVDGDFAIKYPEEGIWVYRNANAEKPSEGDLTVFDEPSDTNDFAEMKKDQLNKLTKFNGKCTSDPSVPCDLFMLSWITKNDSRYGSKKINAGLGEAMLNNPNRHGFYPNLLNTNFTEQARAVFIAQDILNAANKS